MDAPDEFVIPPMSARAATVGAGQVIRIVDVEGGQPGDLVAFNADDLAVVFSQARTRVENRSVQAKQGHALWTNALPPERMLTIVADTCGSHDLLYTPCCRYALEKRFAASRDGCHEHLAEALEPWGIAPECIPDPLNLFFRIQVDASGALTIGKPPSHAGDYIELRAEMPCLVAVATCAVPIPGRENSAYRVTVRNA